MAQIQSKKKKKKAKHTRPEGQDQVNFMKDEEAKEEAKALGVDDEVLEEAYPVEKKKKTGSSDKVTNVRMENYALITGSLEENNLQLKVVSVYDLSTANDLPDPEMLEHEIDAWRRQLSGFISRNSEMLRKAVNVLVR